MIWIGEGRSWKTDDNKGWMFKAQVANLRQHWDRKSKCLL